MSKFKQVDVVEVLAWGKRMGAVARDPNSGYFAFEYDSGFAKRGIELYASGQPILNRMNGL